MSYYYLASTLPMLALDEPPPLTEQEFFDRCREHFGARDLTRLERTLAAPGTRPDEDLADFPARWHARAVQIRNAAARQRAARRQTDAAPFLRPHAGMDASLDARVGDAMGKENPLEREWALDRVRWSVIEELAGYDPFAGAALLAYALKLRLARRWAEMDEEKGKQRVQELISENETDEAT